MALTESDRRDIFDSLEAVHGPDVANNLMQLIPHQPAAHLVTREDMHANTQMLRGEMAELRGELHHGYRGPVPVDPEPVPGIAAPAWRLQQRLGLSST